MAADAMRIALSQSAPLPAGRPDVVAANLQRLSLAAAHAAAAGAALLVTPEMGFTGYNIGAARVQQLAEPPDGPIADMVATIARSAGIAIVYGYPERDGASVFNAAQCIGRDGRRLGHHRKTHLYGELDRAMFTPGDDGGTPFELDGWRVALLICYDVEFPENVRRLALAGADLIVVPTANMLAYDFVATHLVPVRAYESQVVMAYANHCGHEGAIGYGGLSCVVTPDGRDAARAGRGEQLLVADLDRGQLLASRKAYPYLRDLRKGSGSDGP